MATRDVKRRNKCPLPISHPPVGAPLCSNCSKHDTSFFDPGCPGCVEIIKSPTSTIAEIYAILRLWVPQIQKGIEMLAKEIIKRGGHVDDRDGLTDMTLLHYSCKAGAGSVGDVSSAVKVVHMLIDYGANVNLRCKWTEMNALHYAAFFDVAPVIKVLLERCKEIDINSTCKSCDKGSALHICAVNLCIDSADMLLKLGADRSYKDIFSRTPYECIPDINEYAPERIECEKILKMQKLFLSGCTAEENGVTSGEAVLTPFNFSLNDRVMVDGCKAGLLRFCGYTEFAPGIWAGVELDDSDGKNDGSVNGVVYFKCSSNHGIFLQVHRICKMNECSKKSSKNSTYSKPNSKQTVKYGKVDISHVKPKVCTGWNVGPKLEDIKLDDKVIIRKKSMSREKKEHCGWVRYIGETGFAPGIWIGLELDKDVESRHDGSVGETRYFTCPPKRGILMPISRFRRISKKRESCSVAHDAAPLEGMEIDNIKWEVYYLTSPKKDSHTGTKANLDSQGSISEHLSRLSIGCSSSSSPASRRCTVNMLKSTQSCEGSAQSAAIGMNALYNHNIGIVRYVGPVEFAEGNWLGLELRVKKGKHDGCVNGKRYFTSKPGHGIMVRPKNVTIHGINGEKLIGTKC